MYSIQRKIGDLYLKYGTIPNEDGLRWWYEAILRNQNKGFHIEKACIEAAKEVFGEDFRDDSLSIKSSTQSLMVLLQQLGEIINGK